MTSSLCWSPTTFSSGIPILLRTTSSSTKRPRGIVSENFDLKEGENMKRRNGQAEGKRRPVKRTKLTDNIFGSTLVYVKLLLLWALVLAADYLLEFRFEYLWPFWLLVRSIYDSFKYQGLAFSVFFICIALTSDMICFLFIPVHWLFFAASTYVWVQYVWHTEKGICLPTVFLLASLCLHRSRNSSEVVSAGVQTAHRRQKSSFSLGSLPALCSALHWVSCGDAW